MTISQQEIKAMLQVDLTLIAIGASRSINVVVPTRSAFLDLLLGGFINAVDSRLKHRVLMTCPPIITHLTSEKHYAVLMCRAYDRIAMRTNSVTQYRGLPKRAEGHYSTKHGEIHRHHAAGWSFIDGFLFSDVSANDC